MGRVSSPRNGDEVRQLSCWGRLKLQFPWIRRRIISSSSSSNTGSTRQGSVSCNSIAAALLRTNKPPKPAGGFKYDPLSYAQNFDEGCWDDYDEDIVNRGFASRFTPSSSSGLHDHKQIVLGN